MRGQAGNVLRLAIAAVALGLCLVGTAAGQGLVDLRYQFTEGDATRAKLVIDNATSTSESVSGSSWRQRQRQEFMFDVRVSAVDEAGAGTIEMTIASLKVMTEQPDQEKVEFDSTKPAGQRDEDAGSRELSSLLGEVVTIEVSPDGAVKAMRGVDLIARAMTAQLAANDLAGALTRSLVSAVGDSAMEQTVRNGLCLLPGRPVRRGESWTSVAVQQMPLVGGVRSTWRNRLTDAGRRTAVGDVPSQIAKIDSDIRIELSGAQEGDGRERGRTPPNAWVELQPGVSVRLNDASGKATTQFDSARGRCVRVETSVTMPVEVRVAAMGDEADAPTLCQTLESTMVFEDLGPAARR